MNFLHIYYFTGFVLTHTEATPYKCPECDKSYRHRHSLSTHRRIIHRKQFRYSCSQCGKGTDRPSQLKHHRCPLVDNTDTAVSATNEIIIPQSSIQVTGMHNLQEGTLFEIPELPLGVEGDNIYLVIEQSVEEAGVTVTI